MIKFFRKIRYNLMSENKTGKYLKYAIGEIILVVIGILIALQINNWNDNKKDKRLEEYYLSNLREDLKSDSVKLAALVHVFDVAVYSKEKLINYAQGNHQKEDSLAIYLKNQINFVNDFTPNTTTIDEIKNSSHLNIISDNSIRRNLVKLYNTYDNLSIKLALGTEKQQKMVDYFNIHLSRLDKPTKEETIEIMSGNFVPNLIRTNYLYTQSNKVKEAYNLCLMSINSINNILND